MVDVIFLADAVFPFLPYTTYRKYLDIVNTDVALFSYLRNYLKASKFLVAYFKGDYYIFNNEKGIQNNF